jgi:hypothetical protein
MDRSALRVALSQSTDSFTGAHAKRDDTINQLQSVPQSSIIDRFFAAYD